LKKLKNVDKYFLGCLCNISSDDIAVIYIAIFKLQIERGIMNRIKEVLTEKRITQIWLSERLGKSYNMVNSYCQNRRQPSLEDLNKIADILDIDVRELVQSNK
jgi:ribosome-binding protein aMBF1 (putative translation factor)